MAILAAVLGPVLAALFVAELATEGHWRDSAPTPAQEKPVADRSGGVTGSPEPVTHDSDGPSADPAAESSHPGEDGKDGKDGDKSKDKDQKKDEDGTSSGSGHSSSSDEPGVTASAPGGGSGPAQPSTSPPQPGPSAPATTAPTPAPSPTRTCKRVLWWCT
ncbi:hypothetical protein ABZS86_20820 [Streptomyces sp. NPDC005355]|uniref:hypothetical protein n=1 Tax=Streptomyces sp. NPDC005355 TaxID=3157038 RepID=UPI0033AAF4CE